MSSNTDEGSICARQGSEQGDPGSRMGRLVGDTGHGAHRQTRQDEGVDHEDGGQRRRRGTRR
jgi:hypothetical protein